MTMLIIDFGAQLKTSNTVEMWPLAGDIANVSYFKINASPLGNRNLPCIAYIWISLAGAMYG